MLDNHEPKPYKKSNYNKPVETFYGEKIQIRIITRKRNNFTKRNWQTSRSPQIG